MHKLIAILLVWFLLPPLAFASSTSSNYRLEGESFNGGVEPDSSSTSYTSHNEIGKPGGNTSSGNYNLNEGLLFLAVAESSPTPTPSSSSSNSSSSSSSSTSSSSSSSSNPLTSLVTKITTKLQKAFKIQEVNPALEVTPDPASNKTGAPINQITEKNPTLTLNQNRLRVVIISALFLLLLATLILFRRLFSRPTQISE